MKKYNILILACILFIFNACKEDFLDTVKIGEQTAESFYSNDAQIVQAVNACYAPLWEYHYNWARTDLESYPTDESIRREPYGFHDYTFNANQFLFSYKYRYNYRGILMANQLISRLDGKDIPGVEDKDLQKRVVAEAKFMRAYYYFDLVKAFGGVPLVDRPLSDEEIQKVRRAKASEVYKLIESDLIAAVPDLLTKPDYVKMGEVGRASKGAALGLLVNVCVAQASPGYAGQEFYNTEKWKDAKKYAKELFALPYSLYQGDYHDIFTEAGENGPGSIFEVQFYDSPLDDGAYTCNGNFNTFLNMPWFGAADPYGEYQVTYDLYLAFDDDDPRREASIINDLKHAEIWKSETPVTGSLTGFYNYKHYLTKEQYVAIGNFRNSPINERIIRLSDIYLLYAEACYHTGEEASARDYVNRVRARARNGNSEILPDITASGEDLLNAIYHERRVELCNEGHRWFDLVRTGRLEQVVKVKGYKVKANLAPDGKGGYIITDSEDPLFHANNLQMPKNMLYPIPQSEIDNSNGAITQNPGY